MDTIDIPSPTHNSPYLIADFDPHVLPHPQGLGHEAGLVEVSPYITGVSHLAQHGAVDDATLHGSGGDVSQGPGGGGHQHLLVVGDC